MPITFYACSIVLAYRHEHICMPCQPPLRADLKNKKDRCAPAHLRGKRAGPLWVVCCVGVCRSSWVHTRPPATSVPHHSQGVIRTPLTLVLTDQAGGLYPPVYRLSAVGFAASGDLKRDA